MMSIPNVPIILILARLSKNLSGKPCQTSGWQALAFWCSESHRSGARGRPDAPPSLAAHEQLEREAEAAEGFDEPTEGGTANPLAQGWEERWSDEERRPYWLGPSGQSTWTRPARS
jgi:hypothetical protein